MKILIVGCGGREHALAWKCAQSPQGLRSARRARQRRHRHRAARAQRRRRRRGRRGPRGAREGRAGRPDHHRPRGAARDRRRRRVHRRRPALFRAAPGRRAARRLQGLHQGIPEAPRHSHRRVRDVHARDLRPGVGAPAAHAHRREGQRPGGRQRRGHRGLGRRGDRDRAGDVRRAIRLRRRPGGHRGIPARRGSQLHRHGRRQERRDHGDLAGPQAPQGRGRGPEHGRHGRVFARAGGRPRHA